MMKRVVYFTLILLSVAFSSCSDEAAELTTVPYTTSYDTGGEGEDEDDDPGNSGGTGGSGGGRVIPSHH